MKKLIVALALLLSACGDTTTTSEPDWFEYQYEGGSPLAALTECGPTVASNNLCWQTGVCKGRKYARSTLITPSWWYMAYIQYFINQEGGEAEIRTFSKDDVLKNMSRGNLIFHVNHTHFVTVKDKGSTGFEVYDTNSGITFQKYDEFFKKVSFGKYLVVPKL